MILEVKEPEIPQNREDEERGMGAGKNNAPPWQNRSLHLHAVERHYLKKNRKFQFCFGIVCLKTRSYYLSHIANKYNGDFPAAMIIKALKNINYSEEAIWRSERRKINQNCYAKNISHLVILIFFNTSSDVHHHVIMGSLVKGEFSGLQITSRSSPYCFIKKMFFFSILCLSICVV